MCASKRKVLRSTVHVSPGGMVGLAILRFPSCIQNVRLVFFRSFAEVAPLESSEAHVSQYKIQKIVVDFYTIARQNTRRFGFAREPLPQFSVG